MILIISNYLDDTAGELLKLFPAGKASLFTSQHLSSRGIAAYSNQFNNSYVTIEENSLSVESITGVITLIPSIFPWELIQIEKEDREYVAGEMTAFMIYFLSCLRCPKLNPPSPSCLSGFNWRQEHWIKKAFELRIPVKPIEISSREKIKTNYLDAEIITIIIIGNQFCGQDNELLISYAFHLARHTGMKLLQVNFIKYSNDETYFLSASQFPDLDNNSVMEAMVDYFTHNNV